MSLTPSLTIAPDTFVESPPPSPHTVEPEPEAGSLASAPFALVLYQRDKTPSGYFRPEAAIEITPALRTSGLLTTLPAEEMQSLLAVLSFVTPNGVCQPSIFQIANALKRPEGKARSRMQRLASVVWHEHPLVMEMVQESGMVVYAPSRRLFTVRYEGAEEQAPLPMSPVPAGREAILAHSRSLYARPRVEVEREIARLNGWDDPHPQTPEEKERLEIMHRLLGIGISREQTETLLQRFPAEVISQQIDWLPYRNAIHPGRFLIAAIEGNYDAPFTVRLQQAAQQEEAVEQENAASGETDPIFPDGAGEGTE